MSILISVPAGRCHRRSPDSKWVDPAPEKGSIEMKFEDDLMHLWWKSKSTGSIEDELIVFPGEATFEQVKQDPTGRTHILKFSSSDQNYFFWFQRANKSTDLRAQVDLNAFLQDPSYRVGSAPLPAVAAAIPSTPMPSSSSGSSGPSAPGAPARSAAGAASLEPAATPSAPSAGTGAAASSSSLSTQEEMARLLVQWAQSGGISSPSGAAADDAARLTDVLSPANITALVRSDPSIGARLKPLLPPALGLSENPTAEDLIPVLTAPQITDAVASLDNALRSGGLPGGMMRDLGLPEGAGTSVKAFLDALAGLKKGDAASEDRMETDE
ncbi:proteasome complex subunit Rpn13 ubiquitin receptor-domain-containing protein [Dioszegia hungarica]|uniref:Proteasome complex subunit Rpn13 ubiquitin receptor-domain-containing protein n=1 Tax=Dioszegia hungarica TaxID=4972 RepID=A0AA38H5Y3_9TREE|nr:proteasome complex subunit Rpn13 ubiquitin receptor-domain-containing protein [Dioszegia hungarica]KAI9633084.1 proteasome complex subunit Rpn13 ubiquitin receptor-domain-containing protein [Dioszegia hungarica]